MLEKQKCLKKNPYCWRNRNVIKKTKCWKKIEMLEKQKYFKKLKWRNRNIKINK